MPKCLTDAEHILCRQLWQQKLTDVAIAKRINRAHSTVQKWRVKNGLPAHRQWKRRPEPKPPAVIQAEIERKRMLTARRPEWERLLIRKFGGDLINSAENCEKPDIGAFMNEWRIVRRGFVNELPRG